MRVRTRVPSLLSCLLTALAVTASTGLLTAPAASAQTSREAAFVERINSARARHGLPPLRVRDGLTDYARQHSRQMAGRRTLFHTADFSVICCWAAVAENVGTGFSVRQVHRAFMSSPGHRATMLDPDLRAVGVGVVRVGDRLWVTQVFRDPR